MLTVTLETAQESIEPSRCSDCPFFFQSTRLPSSGFCKLYDEVALGKDIPGELCITEFWSLANSTKFTHSYQPKITVTQGKGKQRSTAALALRSGKTLVVSID